MCMADIIRDCKNRVICYGDAMTGMVENKYKSQILKMYIPIGGNLSIKRDDTMTYIRRRNQHRFDVMSHII